jgi:hypothetical protein
MQANIFGFVDDAHSTAAKLFQDAVMGNCFANCDHSICQMLLVQRILGGSLRQVNASALCTHRFRRTPEAKGIRLKSEKARRNQKLGKLNILGGAEEKQERFFDCVAARPKNGDARDSAATPLRITSV